MATHNYADDFFSEKNMFKLALGLVLGGLLAALLFVFLFILKVYLLFFGSQILLLGMRITLQ